MAPGPSAPGPDARNPSKNPCLTAGSRAVRLAESRCGVRGCDLKRRMISFACAIEFGSFACLLARFVLSGACLSACSNPSSNTGGSKYSLPDGVGDVHVSAPIPCTGTCPVHAASSGTCDGGFCAYTCYAGFLDCDGNVDNGCEADGTTSASHCGTCDNACPSAANAAAQCIKSTCALTCDPGWSDCVPGSDGCETATDTSPDHCGDCTTVCASGPHSKPACQGGTCGLLCQVGYSDCNNDPTDGCETNTASDPNHCGACGLSCKDVACVAGSCVCASTSSSATLVPLDMYIMMDQSKSMNEATGTPGVDKWQAISQAISAFVGDPKSAGIGVGIQYFGLPGGGGGGGKDSCNASVYATPAVVIASLPGNAGAITQSVAQHGPTTSTPTAPALQGAINYAKSYAAAHPGHTVVAVLATDGQPTECSPTAIPSIAAIAAAGASGTPKVLTFVIGVGSSLSNLNAIAVGGGSKQAFVVDQGGNVVQQFEAALQAIQGQAIGCAYGIPQPAAGQTLDVKKLNVQVTLGGVQTILTYGDSAATCDPAKGGWYFDDPAAPTKILLCPATCTAVTGKADALVDVLLGCARSGGN